MYLAYFEVNDYSSDPWLTRLSGRHELFDCSFELEENEFRHDPDFEKLVNGGTNGIEAQDLVASLVSYVDDLMAPVCSIVNCH